MVNFLDALRITHIAGIVEKLVMPVVIIYLTDVWEIGIIHAAGLINVCVGTTKVLPLIFLFLLDNYISSYSMLIFSNTTSALGMGLMSISTPSWHYRLITGSCSEYKRKCISEKQQWFFYLALVLIMIGGSSREATMETITFKGDEIEQKSKKQLVTFESDYVAVQAGVLLLAPWSILFGISSVLSSMALFLLMGKSWSHKLYINKHETSPVTTVVRVFVASTSKIFQKLPYSADFYQKMEIDDSPLHCSSTLRLYRLRFLEKAAIRLPTDNERQNMWTRCSIQEVEDTKTLVRMLPMGVYLVILVLLSSIGSNYFIEQAKRLKPTVISGFEFINISYFFKILISTEFQYHEARKKYIKDIWARKEEMLKRDTMFICLAVLMKEIVPAEIIRMFIWLLILVFLLGFIESSLEQVIQLFFDDGMSLCMEKFRMFMVEAFLGVGYMSSVLVVYIVGERLNWLQHYMENNMPFWLSTCLLIIILSWHHTRVLNSEVVMTGHIDQAAGHASLLTGHDPGTPQFSRPRLGFLGHGLNACGLVLGYLVHFPYSFYCLICSHTSHRTRWVFQELFFHVVAVGLCFWVFGVFSQFFLLIGLLTNLIKRGYSM